MDPTWCMYNLVPRLCGLRRCSRELCVLKTWLRDFLCLRAGEDMLIEGHVNWMEQPLPCCRELCCLWAFPSPFIRSSLENNMLHLKPVAALLMSGYRHNTASLCLFSMRLWCMRELPCFAKLLEEFNIKQLCFSSEFWGSLLKWPDEPNVQAHMVGWTEEIKQNSKNEWLKYSASFSKGKRVYANPWKLLHIVLIQGYT